MSRPARRPGPTGGNPGLQRIEGYHPVLEALRARRRPLRRLLLRDGVEEELRRLREAAAAARVPIEIGDSSADREGRAVVLEAGPLPELDLEGLLATLPEAGATPRSLLALDGVEDPQNLGAIARVADGAGVLGLVLTRRRAPPLSPAVARASAGAIEWLPTARVPNLPRALEGLKRSGFWVFGADPEEGADLYTLPDRVLAGDRVWVLGAEGRGLRQAALRALDHRVRVPLRGRVASLNVATAAAVLLFEAARRDRLAPGG